MNSGLKSWRRTNGEEFWNKERLWKYSCSPFLSARSLKFTLHECLTVCPPWKFWRAFLRTNLLSFRISWLWLSLFLQIKVQNNSTSIIYLSLWLIQNTVGLNRMRQWQRQQRTNMETYSPYIWGLKTLSYSEGAALSDSMSIIDIWVWWSKFVILSGTSQIGMVS